MAGAKQRKGLVLGIYEAEKDADVKLSKATQGFQTDKAQQLTQLIDCCGLKEKKGKCRVFYGIDPDYSSVAVVSLGKKGAGYSELDDWNESRESIRSGVAAGVRQLQDAGVNEVFVDPCGDPQAAAEGAYLSLYNYEELKAKDKHKTAVQLHCFSEHSSDKAGVEAAWKLGSIFAEGQNFAKRLMETPANHMTPTRFAELATEKLGPLNNVKVTVRDKAWAESMKMGSFLSVAKGSDEPLKFVEVEYKGGNAVDPPLAIVGKGITFDSGGISIKPSAGMEDMRADMGGAACTLGSLYTVARLGLPINVMGFMPLCENMPNGRANKPGDVVTAMNGKTIQIDNTDAEGRLILCDAICYAETFKPRGIIDLATLTGAMMVALGAAATGVFTTSNHFWDTMHKAGIHTGDRVWRMPIYKLYSKQMTECHLADLNNLGSGGRLAGASTAAAFIKEFVSSEHWMHMDIAGVMKNKSEVPYLGAGMTGRPTRTLVEFMHQLTQL